MAEEYSTGENSQLRLLDAAALKSRGLGRVPLPSLCSPAPLKGQGTAPGGEGSAPARGQSHEAQSTGGFTLVSSSGRGWC